MHSVPYEFAFANADGRAALIAGDTVYFLEDLSGGKIPADPFLAVSEHWDEVVRLGNRGAFGGGKPLDEVLLGPPVPTPRAIFGIGLNYRAHAEEAGLDIPSVPPVFTKFPTSICGPFDDVLLPHDRARVDYEAELVFILAKEGKNLKAEDAWDVIAGFTCGQDFSERTLQFSAGRQFSMGKSYDTFFPMGPWIVPVEFIDNIDDLRVRCRLNGEVVQDGVVADMVFSVPELVEFLSSVVRLRPGDVCLTGTPAGVGYVKNPPRFLEPGDVVETEIDGIGTMRNVCKAAWQI